jgi:hypothetical protein
MAGFVLTDKNYYTPEADRHYMSCSLLDRASDCEHRTLAEITGRIEPPKKESRAFVVGHYFHAVFEGAEALQEFADAHWNEIYKTASRAKYADIAQADEMLKTAYSDPAIRRLIDLDGEAEKIMTGTLFGAVPWRVRLDKYVASPQRVIIDWKTVADLHETFYDEERGRKVGFVEHWGYDRRAAAYIEVERQQSGEGSDALFFLVCLTKQKPPDKDIFMMNDRAALDAALDGMREKALHFWAVMQGQEEPRRCGRCAYCRKTKKIREPALFTAKDVW